MSRTLRTFNVGLLVRRTEHLPDDMDDDNVVDELRDVVQAAIGKWYAERGHELVVVEPVVG